MLLAQADVWLTHIQVAPCSACTRGLVHAEGCAADWASIAQVAGTHALADALLLLQKTKGCENGRRVMAGNSDHGAGGVGLALVGRHDQQLRGGVSRAAAMASTTRGTSILTLVQVTHKQRISISSCQLQHTRLGLVEADCICASSAACTIHQSAFQDAETDIKQQMSMSHVKLQALTISRGPLHAMYASQ